MTFRDRSPAERTFKEMLARPELVEHFAFNKWHAHSGIVGSLAARECWDAMSEANRALWIDRVWTLHRESIQ